MRFPMAHTATSYFATDLEAMQATCEPFAKARPFFLLTGRDISSTLF